MGSGNVLSDQRPGSVSRWRSSKYFLHLTKQVQSESCIKRLLENESLTEITEHWEVQNKKRDFIKIFAAEKQQ